jgi:two-component system chemotaxis sensor kinase CheA
MPDEEFIARLRATFKVEADEHLQAISTTLLELEKTLANPSPTAVEKVFREVHSLKGAARAVDLSRVEAICQAMESVFALWKKELSAPSADSLDTLHKAVDEIRSLLDSQDSPSSSSLDDELIGRLSRLQFAPSSPAPRSAPRPHIPARKISPPPEPIEEEKPHTIQTVRIPIEKLDQRLLQAEDMLTLKTIAGARVTELREMSSRFDRWHREWAKISVEVRSLRQTLEHSDAAGNADSATAVMVNFLDWNADYLRTLDHQIRSLAAQADQDRHAVSKRVDDLLVDSKKLLVLPFATVAEMFPKLIRDLCRDQKKEAQLVIRGQEVEIDKRILEEVKDALIHILRNCVDHGIETPDQRTRLGKPAQATITISVSPVNGDKCEILVSDDGAGIDVERVKKSAVEHGIITAADAAILSNSEALKLIFHSEVSTRSAVTAISGRGLGMAIVRAKAEKLAGQLSIQSQPNAGTTLRLLLPLTLATFRGVLVSVAGRIFVIPTVNLQRVLRLKPQEIRSVENRQVITLQGRPVSLARLESVLELPPSPVPQAESASVTIAVCSQADQRIGFIVDEVLREEEVLVKPLRKPLVRVRNIAGATVLATGKTALVLNVPDLLQSARKHGHTPLLAPANRPSPAKPKKRVMVVEDSITSRMLLKGILEGAGFDVATAVDGIDALTTLREGGFDLVVSDVEMPRMNGLDLASRIRADRRLEDLPVILVTALETRQERERGMDAGASAYLAKSSFEQTNLLETIQRLL